jgi:hypothetical protein
MRLGTSALIAPQPGEAGRRGAQLQRLRALLPGRTQSQLLRGA